MSDGIQYEKKVGKKSLEKSLKWNLMILILIHTLYYYCYSYLYTYQSKYQSNINQNIWSKHEVKLYEISSNEILIWPFWTIWPNEKKNEKKCRSGKSFFFSIKNKYILIQSICRLLSSTKQNHKTYHFEVLQILIIFLKLAL